MLLNSIKLRGFKSFPDTIEVSLEGGITAIVGPNGCGKSNIADSINWALGEQSPTSLRGKRMEQMIFNGSSSRKASGMAEVTVSLSTNGKLSGAVELQTKQDEQGLERAGSELHSLMASVDGKVAVTRRMFRDAQSEYLINGRPCRLRDVQDLLMALGIGSRVITIVEQDKINSILNARPVDRRVLIEDAAGITKFKLNKHLTQLKLERASQNLLRIEDLLSEQEVHVRRLRRQAARARRYRRTLAEVRNIEAALLAARHAETRRLQESANLKVQELEERLATTSANLAGLESGHAALRQELDEKTEKQVALRETHYHGSLEIDRDSQRLKHLRENLDGLFKRSEEIRLRLTATQQRSEEKQSQLEAAAKSLAGSERDLQRAYEEFNILKQRTESADADLEAIRREKESGSAALSQWREETAAERSRLENLLSEERRLAAGIANAQALGKKRRASIAESDAKIHGIKKNQAELEEQLTENTVATARCEEERTGLEKEAAALKRRLETLRLSLGGTEATLAALLEMEERHEGVEEAARAVLENEEVRLAVRPKGIVADWVELQGPMAPAALAVYGRLLEAVVVQDEESAKSCIALLKEKKLGRATFVVLSKLPDAAPSDSIPDNDPRRAVVPRGEMGLKLMRLFPPSVVAANLKEALRLSMDGSPAVTADGTVVRNGRTVRGGSKARREELFTRRIRMEELRREKESYTKEITELERKHREFEELGAGLLTELEALNKRGEELRLRKAELSVQGKAASGERDRIVDAAGENEQQLAALREQHVQVRDRAAEATRKLAELERMIGDAEGKIRLLESQLQKSSTEVGTAREEENALRAAISAAEERVKAVQARLETLEGDREAIEKTLHAYHKELESLEEQRIGHLHEIDAIESGMEAKIEANENLRRNLDALEGELGELAAAVRKKESEIKEARKRHEELHEELERHRLEAREQLLALKHIREKAAESLNLDESGLDSISPDEEQLDHEKAERQLAELKDRVEKMGPVNLLAGEEYDRHMQRYNLLADQRKDIVDSIASLEKIIARIDRVSRNRFREAFDRINENFHNTFRRLFGGGRAELALGEGDLLEAGVEILVQPPGKRLQSATLLSGGEKSLAAMAIIMAVLEYRPSPFCVLDEADAALDEPNIKKVAALLREYCDKTQFILITHNKATMEVADRLYGVTMEEPGVSKVVTVRFDN